LGGRGISYIHMWNHENLVRKEKKRNEKKTTPNREAWRNHLSERKPHKPFSLYVFFQHEKNMIGFDRSLVPFSTHNFQFFFFKFGKIRSYSFMGWGSANFWSSALFQREKKRKERKLDQGRPRGDGSSKETRT